MSVILQRSKRGRTGERETDWAKKMRIQLYLWWWWYEKVSHIFFIGFDMKTIKSSESPTVYKWYDTQAIVCEWKENLRKIYCQAFRSFCKCYNSYLSCSRKLNCTLLHRRYIVSRILIMLRVCAEKKRISNYVFT